MLELNDSSTSFGRSVSVRVGEGMGDDEREEPALGEDERSIIGCAEQ